VLSLIYDTETTGLFDFKLPLMDMRQPEIIQLCAKLSLDGKILSTVNLFVHGEKDIEPKAYETHRIDRAMTAAVGVSRSTMARVFANMAHKADVLVGHNEEFDQKMVTRAIRLEGGTAEVMQQKAHFCTMKASTDLCRIPSPKRPGEYKWPSLKEAYAALVDPRGFSNAHDAEADVDACHEVYRVLRKRAENLEAA
jgi:DNA polymerase-3 subunit epsilon